MKAIISYLAVYFWIFISTLFYKNTDLIEHIPVYFPFFFIVAMILVSSHQYIICKVKHKCEKTNSIRIGCITLSVLLTVGLLLIATSLHLKSAYILFQNPYLIKSFILFNPVIMFYVLYQRIKEDFTKK